MPSLAPRTLPVFSLLFAVTLMQATCAEVSPSPFETEAKLTPAGTIDELVFDRLKKLGIQPANLCSDAVFLRRVYLDVTGTLPSVEETQSFLKDESPDKRAKLIDRLLESEKSADSLALKWCDLLRVKAEFPINLWPHAAQMYHRWIRECFRNNMPCDRFARELLTANGSNFRVPQVNFYRAMQNREPQGIAQTVALTFMGARAEKWPKERLDGMAVYFSRLTYKSTAEWKEEIVFFDEAKSATAVKASSAPPSGGLFSKLLRKKDTKESGAGGPAGFPEVPQIRLAPDQDPRVAFANWLLASDNPWFTRNIANRAWSWLLGRGIIHEPDDIRPDNPPSNPELLSYLQRELVSNRYDLKKLYRTILTSRTYQFSSIPRSDKPEADAQFARYALRRLDAEVLIDALCQITGTTEKYVSSIPEPFTYIPEDQRSMTLPDGSISSSFLELFGRPPRDTGMEAERNNRPTAAQRLHLLNSSHVRQKLEQSPKLTALFQSAKLQEEIVTGLYLAILSRYPTQSELEIAAPPKKSKSREGMFDVAWALMNSSEFLCRH